MPDTPTLAAYAADWFPRLDAIPLGVRRAHRSALERILIPTFGDATLDVFTPTGIVLAFERLERRAYTPRQRARCLSALRALFADAVARGVVAQDPTHTLFVTVDGQVLADHTRARLAGGPTAA